MIYFTKIKNDFPILKRKIYGRRLVYLDSANTSLTPKQVIKAMDRYYTRSRANIHRAVYKLGEEATQAYELAREKVRSFINANSFREIIFTRNATESINLVAQAWGRANLKKKDMIVISLMEHHSNIVPWQMLQKEKGFHIHYLSVDREGRLNLDELKQVLKQKNVKFVSLIHQSNVLGTVNPVREIVALSHKAGACVLIDGAQAVPHLSVNIQDINADFYVFTGHKMLGPTGIGVLFGKESILERMPPFLGGGDMIRSVQREGSTWNDLPYKFEAGTPNIAGAIGLGAAIDYLCELDMNHVHHAEQELLQYGLKIFKQVQRLKIFGSQSINNRGAIFTFTIPGIHPHDLATLLGEKGICVRAGNHCAQPLHDYFGISATTRASFYFYNTTKDIDDLIEALIEIQKMFS